MTYTLTAIQANGAMLLRSSLQQDKTVNAHEMIAAVKKVYPSNKFEVSFNYPFFTFDGDRMTQIAVRVKSILDNMPHYVHGSEMQF